MAKKIEPIALTELIQQVQDELANLNGTVSELRQHSVMSHLWISIRQLGYAARDAKDKPATLTDLAAQFARALKAENGEAPEGMEDILRLNLSAVLSNLKADSVGLQGPPLKEMPEETATA